MPAGNLQDLVNAVKTLYNNRQTAEDMGKTGRIYIQENLSKEKCTGMYVDTLKSVSNKG